MEENAGPSQLEQSESFRFCLLFFGPVLLHLVPRSVAASIIIRRAESSVK